MKFRFKVLFINIIFLSISLSAIGYMMITKNFSLALEAQIKNAVEENNFIQSAVEYQLLDVINENKSAIATSIYAIGPQITSGMSANGSEIFIEFNGKVVYSQHPDITYPKELCDGIELGEKNYEICKENGEYYIYVTSYNMINTSGLHIINRRSISSAYSLLKSQTDYYMFLIIIVLAIDSFAMLVVSHLLTKPMVRLNQISSSFAGGNYSERAVIKSNDEVGELATTYNLMAEAVSEHIDRLQGMITRQEQFVADFTHEIKTPMTTIIGYADTLRSKDMSRENQITAASYIFSEGKRLETMSKKLFDLIYLKQHEITTAPVPIPRLMNEVALITMPGLKKKDIKLTMLSLDACINGDLELLKSAFINLIDNARKASTDGGQIIFEAKKNGGEAVISVRDFGVGIAEENLEKICNEFYMVDKSRTREEGGAGLGLSLAALIFTCHHTKLDIQSKLDYGTTMSASFQIIKEVDDNEKA